MFKSFNNQWESTITKKVTVKWHFTKCNNSKCNSIFLVNPEEIPGEPHLPRLHDGQRDAGYFSFLFHVPI